MRRLFPDPVDGVDLSEAYAPEDLLPGPFVRLNMISSLDGAISVDGRSGPLGGAGDRRVFAAIRSHADVILVGAGTARAEGYGPARVSAADEAVRVARGQDAQPRIAVVSGSLRLNWSSPFFTDAHARPAVVTTSSAALHAPDEARDVAELVAVGEDRVDLAAALAAFASEGARTVLVEGGPGVNGDLARAGLIDELCLTVSPRVVGGDGARIMAGPAFDPPFAPVVRHILEEDGFLFLRMSLREAPEPPGA